MATLDKTTPPRRLSPTPPRPPSPTPPLESPSPPPLLSFPPAVLLWTSATICCMVPFSFGVALGFTSPALPDMKAEGLIGEEAGSWFSSLMPLAAIVGAILAGRSIDRLGRKLSFYAVGLPFCFGWMLILAASAVGKDYPSSILALLFTGRILTGISTGAGACLSPTYLSELAPAKWRGTMGSMNQLFVTMGLATVYIFGLLMGWVWITAASAIPPAILVVTIFIIPESPRWLISQGRQHEAFESLKRIRNEDDEEIHRELDEIQETLSQQRPLRCEDWGSPRLYRPLIVSLGLMVFQQFSGVNAVNFYAQDIFEKAGYSDDAAAAAIFGATQFSATLVSVLVIDFSGRRLLLLISGAGISASLLVAGVADLVPKDLSQLSLAAFLIYIVFFSFGFGPIPWLMMSEVFPNFAKVTASSIATLVNWGGAFVVTKTFINLMDGLGSYGCYWFYAAWSLLSCFFVFFAVPETKGVPLEKIAQLFEKQTSSNGVNPTEQTYLLPTDLI